MNIRQDIRDHIEFIRLLYRYGEAPYAGHLYQLILMFFATIGLMLIFVVI